jgi:hypothetical protein
MGCFRKKVKDSPEAGKVSKVQKSKRKAPASHPQPFSFRLLPFSFHLRSKQPFISKAIKTLIGDDQMVKDFYIQ